MGPQATSARIEQAAGPDGTPECLYRLQPPTLTHSHPAAQTMMDSDIPHAAAPACAEIVDHGEYGYS